MKFFRFVFESMMLPALMFTACACSTESAMQQLLGLSVEAPVFMACKTVSEWELSFQFSLPVQVSSLHFDPPLEVESVTGGEYVTVILAQPPEGGKRIMADIVVEDEGGNTLNVLVPFRTRNNNIPPLMITEVRTEYSKPKVEFVELRTLRAGNVGAMRLFIASSGMETPVFEFPPAEVGADEYLVVHLRTLEPESINETGGDLGASPYSGDNEALPEARDFWVPGTTKRIKKTDIILCVDQDDRIIDALLLSETSDPWWKTEDLAKAAEMAGRQDAWLSLEAAAEQLPGPGSAVSSRYTTATRSISRDEATPDSNSAADWYITATSNATPGRLNSVKRYVPKE
ncbi:MAG: hypothetical protein LBD78_02825 [Spirochaetaceae bacterium]|jgi:hypothetical protein|nr:hypothetical protein [Spirochaetaceae bacterium]